MSLLLTQLLFSTACEPWCLSVACSELNGDVEHECGGCGAHAACRPGAAGYVARAFVGGTGRVAPGVESTAVESSTAPKMARSNVTAAACRRITADQLRRMNAHERALAEPTIVSAPPLPSPSPSPSAAHPNQVGRCYRSRRSSAA